MKWRPRVISFPRPVSTHPQKCRLSGSGATFRFRTQRQPVDVRISHTIDFLMRSPVVPTVINDPVEVRVGARRQRGMTGASGRRSIIVSAIYEVGPAQQQIEATLHKFGPKA